MSHEGKPELLFAEIGATCRRRPGWNLKGSGDVVCSGPESAVSGCSFPDAIRGIQPIWEPQRSGLPGRLERRIRQFNEK